MILSWVRELERETPWFFFKESLDRVKGNYTLSWFKFEDGEFKVVKSI